jgi:hypothetical protein
MTCREYAESLLRQGWRTVNLEGDTLTLAKDGRLRTIDLRFDTSVKPAGSGAGLSWTTPENIVSSNNQYATFSIAKQANSFILSGYNFGFAIPANNIIQGITAKVEAKAAVADLLAMGYIRLGTYSGGIFTQKCYKDTTGGGTLTTSDVNYGAGSSSDLWGETWTPDYVNSSTFACGISIYNSDSVTRVVSIDYIEITLTYGSPLTGASFLLRMV